MTGEFRTSVVGKNIAVHAVERIAEQRAVRATGGNHVVRVHERQRTRGGRRRRPIVEVSRLEVVCENICSYRAQWRTNGRKQRDKQSKDTSSLHRHGWDTSE